MPVPIRGSHHDLFIGEASKPTFISGKEKYRLAINEDKRFQFAFAILNKDFLDNYDQVKNDWGDGVGKNWIPLLTERGTVKADISSIARRTGFPKSAIRELAQVGNLEEVINKRLAYFTKDYNKIRHCVNSIARYYKIHSPDSQERIKTLINQLPVKINDPVLESLCQKFKKNCQKRKPDSIIKELEKFKVKLHLN